MAKPVQRSRRRLRLSPRHVLLLVLLLALMLTIAWLIGRRPAAPGGGRDPAEIRTASLGAAGDSVQRLSVATAGARPPRAVMQPAPAPAGETDADDGDPRPSRGRAWIFGRIRDAQEHPVAWARVEVHGALDGTMFPALPAPHVLAQGRAGEDGSYVFSFAPPTGGVRVHAWVDGRARVSPVVEAAPWECVAAGDVVEAAAEAAVPDTPLGPAPKLVTRETMPGAVTHPRPAAGGGGLVTLLRGRTPDVDLALHEPGATSWLLPSRPGDWGEVIVLRSGFLPRRLSPDEVLAPPPLREPGFAQLPPPAPGEEPVELVPASADPSRVDEFRFVQAVLGDGAEIVPGGLRLPLEPGSYRVRGAAPAGDDGAPVEIVAGEVTVVDVPSGRPRRRVEGIVVDAVSGAPCPGVAIAAGRGIARLGGDWPALHHTDAAGRFVIEGPPAGPLDLLARAPSHRPAHETVTVGESPDAAVSVRLELTPGDDVAIEMRDDTGASVAGLDLAIVDRHGHVHRARTGADGVATAGPLAPGRYAALVVLGRLSVPVDSWDWIARESGAKTFEAGPTAASPVRWTLPASRPWRFRLELPESAAASATLEIVHAGTAPAPGVWPDLAFEDLHAGVVEIDRMLPGRYRALATVGEEVEVVDFEIGSDGRGPEILTFAFAPEK